MPIYEYECQTCGVHFERKQKVTDDPMQDCPECGGKVRKLFFPVGIIFKGSGWYKTDHGSGAIPPAKGDESAPAKSEPTKSEQAKTEASKTDSAKSDSAKSEPAKSETKKTETKTDKS
jgi:putative FmdB family regulatory protein